MPKRFLQHLILAAAVSPLGASRAADGDLPNPFPRELILGQALHHWDFAEDIEGWTALNQTSISTSGGILRIRTTGSDPYLDAPLHAAGREFVVSMRLRSRADGLGQLFWSGPGDPGYTEARSIRFDIPHDDQWHELRIHLQTGATLERVRLDPGHAEGEVELDWITVHAGGLHPLEIVGITQQPGRLRVELLNHGSADRAVDLNGLELDLAAGARRTVPIPYADAAAVHPFTIRLQSPELPSIHRNGWAYRPSPTLEGVVRNLGHGTTVRAARDGSELRLERAGRIVAVLAPLVAIGNRLPDLRLRDDDWPLVYTGDDISVHLQPTPEGDLAIDVEASSPVEGPVVRVLGGLEQGLLAGVEHLGRGEHSSSRLDIETKEHLRVWPDPRTVTMPLMSLVTEQATVSMAWDDTTLQPVFAVPDFLDGAPGHRMALRGTRIRTTLHITPGWTEGGRLEHVILWAVNRRGLPSLPTAPRSLEDQMQLCLDAFRGINFDPDTGGWFHAVVPDLNPNPNRSAPFADCASAVWRITGEPPAPPRLVPGGSHIDNPAAYFVSGRTAQWAAFQQQRVDRLIRSQYPDGIFRYAGEYRRGHFEDTASGIVAVPAYHLLQHAWYTGNRRSLEAGLQALEALKRFRTPRGAQTWEIPLHTPDILASAYAVLATTRAFVLTGEAEHLAEARRWAISGLPFVYQWSNQPVMTYATVPVLGATNWTIPNWIGLPVQWCGTVYAYALLDLAPHDQTLDWRSLAEGITRCAEQMQYPDGPSRGALPDAFHLPSQSRRPADIHPGALVSLRLRLQGELDALAVAANNAHRVVSPYPVTIENGEAVVHAKAGQAYQILIDGARIVDHVSTGIDRFPLDDASPGAR